MPHRRDGGEELMEENALDALAAQGALGALDVHFARFLGRLAPRPSAELLLGAALASQRRRAGHVCLDLSEAAGNAVLDEDGEPTVVSCPPLDAWCRALDASGVVGRPGDHAPLVLDASSRLYFERLWHAEQTVAREVRARAEGLVDGVDRAVLRDGLQRHFAAPAAARPDLQKAAACTAVLKRLTVISGGPGTGKTHTAAKVLTLLLEQPRRRGAKLRIELAAPTGKAAARLDESLGSFRAGVSDRTEVSAALPETARTLHRVLGWQGPGASPRYHSGRRLDADVVVVDEASMVDVALMAKLLAALQPQARLILLGDRHQLASVEAGSVLADICRAADELGTSAAHRQLVAELSGDAATGTRSSAGAGGLGDSLVELEHSFRFDPHRGIGPLSRAVNAGDGEGALQRLLGGRSEGIEWLEAPDPCSESIAPNVRAAFDACVSAEHPAGAFRALEGFRTLCALRHGPFGVTRLNVLIEAFLIREGRVPRGQRWYRGLPVLVRRNDYALRLFNGDVGLILPDPDAGGQLRAFFPNADGRFRKLAPARLPPWQPAFALTVHQSQGSEFDSVLLVLPPGPSPVVSRELIYTGLTRARQQAAVWGNRRSFVEAVLRRVERSSGLVEALGGKSTVDSRQSTV
jgi:exodeoxyribonuclease V alpha subunit